jgi:hypothetical protein
VLKNVDHLSIDRADLALATYIGPKTYGKYDADLVFATKQFRKLNQRAPDNLFSLNFWYIEEP